MPGRANTRPQVWTRRVVAKAFPISIDSRSFEKMARDPAIQQRARDIRKGLGNPKTFMFVVDRLDYPKCIRHRLKAYCELFLDGSI